MTRPNRAPDIEVSIVFLRTEDGGRTDAAVSGYLALHEIADGVIASGHHEYLDRERVAPGGSAMAEIWFIAPEQHPRTLWVGRELRVLEGSRLVAVATITRIHNVALERPACEVESLIDASDERIVVFVERVPIEEGDGLHLCRRRSRPLLLRPWRKVHPVCGRGVSRSRWSPAPKTQPATRSSSDTREFA